MGERLSGEPRLFYEPGGRWYWVLLGPLAGLIMFGLQVWGKQGSSPVVPLIISALVAFFVALQIGAMRVHATVELTPTELRQGGETLAVSQIDRLYSDEDRHIWGQSRTLGDLKGLPRGRKPVGLRLSGGCQVQAWAKKHERLRAALGRLVPAPSAGVNLGAGDLGDDDVGDDPVIDIESEQ